MKHLPNFPQYIFSSQTECQTFSPCQKNFVEKIQILLVLGSQILELPCFDTKC